MPGARDKLLLNSLTTKGMHKAISAQYRALDVLTEEIYNEGWIDDPECDVFKDELKLACKAHDAADEEYYRFLKDLAARMAEWIDKKRKQTP